MRRPRSASRRCRHDPREPLADARLLGRSVRVLVRAPDLAGADPGTGDPAHDSSTLFCGHCHTTFVKQFQSSAHAMSARDPLVQDLYAGVASAVADAASARGLDHGRVSDWP